MDFYSEIHAKLERAAAARAAGNEGQARVCARRAAGMAARDFLTRHEVRLFDAAQGETCSGSAYEALQTLATFPGLAPNLKQAAVHLTMRVSGEFSLPPGIDLIDEAHKLIRGLNEEN
jgi:hypothetical protein